MHSLLWKFGKLLNPATAMVNEHSAYPLKVFFTDKIDTIRASTVNASSPLITLCEVPPLGLFQEVTCDEVLAMIHAVANKSCTESCTNMGDQTGR